MLVIGRGMMAGPKMLVIRPSAALAPKVVLIYLESLIVSPKLASRFLLVEQNVRMALILAKYGYIIRDGVIMLQGDSKPYQ